MKTTSAKAIMIGLPLKLCILATRSIARILALMTIIILPVAALWGYWYIIGETLIDSTPSHPVIGFTLIFLPFLVIGMIVIAGEDSRMVTGKDGEK